MCQNKNKSVASFRLLHVHGVFFYIIRSDVWFVTILSVNNDP